jgi:hypothetical protein
MQSLLLTMAAINNAIGTFGDNDFVFCGIFWQYQQCWQKETMRIWQRRRDVDQS